LSCIHPHRNRATSHPRLTCSIALAAVLLSAVSAACRSSAQSSAPATTQAAAPSGSPRDWVRAAANNELRIIDDDGTFPLRYRTRKVDAKGDTTREVIESRQGTVARMVERNGKPLTPTEDAAERQRLLDTLAAPADFIKHHKRDASTRTYVMSLVRLMPAAMRYTYAPGQPQPPGAASAQVVIDFAPDPNFKPPTMVSELLTGIEGRLWIDQGTQRLTRGEARVRQPLDMGWGMVARVYPGGTVEFEQADAGNGRWVYSHLVEHLTVREVLVRTAAQNAVVTSSDFRLLPAPISFQDAVHLLLAIPSPAH